MTLRIHMWLWVLLTAGQYKVAVFLCHQHSVTRNDLPSSAFRVIGDESWKYVITYAGWITLLSSVSVSKEKALYGYFFHGQIYFLSGSWYIGGTRWGRSLEPGASSWCPKLLWRPLFCRNCLLLLSRVLLWNASIASSSLICYATMPAPLVCFAGCVLQQSCSNDLHFHSSKLTGR